MSWNRYPSYFKPYLKPRLIKRGDMWWCGAAFAATPKDAYKAWLAKYVAFV